MTAVHQFVPTYTDRSAIGTHTRTVTSILRSMGIETHTWVGEAHGIASGEVSSFRDFPVTPTGPTWLLYQLSIGAEMGDWLLHRSEPVIVNYHNVTPQDIFQPWEPLVVPLLQEGRRQLRDLAGRSPLGVAVSRYNEGEMIAAGYGTTTTVPVLFDLEELGAETDSATVARLDAAKRDGGADWLFVGRIAPNKAQHRLIQALAVHRQLYDPKARLWLVGGSSSHFYETTLKRYAAALGLADAVTLTGSVPQPALVAHFTRADVYISLSEHEGFGIPLVEAMWHRLPVVALGTSGVPETVADAGLVLPDGGPVPPDPLRVATSAHRVQTDARLRDELIARGVARAAAFSPAVTRPLFEQAIRQVVEA
jgi:glycosyltransferase involved in cell wall biosynthesis